jgi:hypothetical protein
MSFENKQDVKNGFRWIWHETLPGTCFFPHQRRWDCAQAIVSALRWLDTPLECARFLARAEAFNAIMFDVNDPLCCAYARRISKIRALHNRSLERV